MRLLIPLTALFTAFILCSCSSTQQHANDTKWIDLFTQSLADSEANHSYTQERVEADYITLTTLRDELTDLTQETASLKRTLRATDQPYFSDAENKQIELAMYRSINARDALAEIVNFYRSHTGDSESTHINGAIIGMSAALTRSYYSSYFCALFHDEADLIKLLNIAHPRYDLPKNCYDRLYNKITDIETLEMLDLSWFLFSQELNQSDSALNKVKQSKSKYSTLITEMDTLHAGTQIHTNYLLYSKRRLLSDLRNRLRQGELAKLGSMADERLQNDLYATRGFIFKNVARIQKPDSRLLEFSDAQVKQIHEALQPGDIILTYSAGYMSNVFLPGNFKHGITYIGTPEQRRTVGGLSDSVLTQAAASQKQAERLIRDVNATTTADGYPIDIVEAVSEGVILNSLDKLLETHINRMVVIRPTLTEQERLQQLLTLFQYMGASYDFKFDFQNDTFQCCTELIYRSINGSSEIDFSLIRMQGRWILAADDILRYYLEHKPSAFEFVLLADQGSDSNDFNAVITEGPAGLEALYELMDASTPSD